MKILLSIKPQYVDKIVSGEKKYEFRKTIFKREQVDTIVVYSSGKVGKLIGEIKFKTILSDTPLNIWNKTKKEAGLSKEDFFDYFMNKNIAYAVKIESFKPYSRAVSIQEKYPGVNPPQSFVYVEKDDGHLF